MTQETLNVPEIAEDAPESAQAEIVVTGSEQAEKPPVVRSHSTPEAARRSEDLNALWKLAEQVSKTEFVPDRFRGKAPQCFAAIVQGRALGVDAMTSLREIWISPDGSPSLSAELQAGLVRKAGHKIAGESTKEGATLTGERSDTGETMTVTFTLEDAEGQGLVQLKDGKPYARSQKGHPLPWERYTEAMLWHRAMTTLVRRLFPDVLIGEME